MKRSLLLLGLLGCGATFGAAPSSFEPLRTTADVLPPGTLIRGPRLVPESVTLERSFGIEPGGGVRGIAAGVRVVSFASGAVLTASDRLAQTPSAIVVLPERLGGGVLFAQNDTLWRAERWLSRAAPVFRAPSPIRAVWVGLDRVYLRMPSNALIAVQPNTGAPLDLGALPPAPTVTAFAAIDGFRAVALADLRGVVVTTDAGATWRSVSVPIEPRTLVLNPSTGESAIVGNANESFDVRAEGDVGRMNARAIGGDDSSSDAAQKLTRKSSGAEVGDVAKIFGARPLALAVTDGVPLADGTVLVARDGSLARVRIADGAIVDFARDAFPLRPARCHGIAIGEQNGAGFVCGEPQGKTHVYRYVPARRGLEVALAFDGPRVVLPAGNGAVAVRGRCAEDALHAAPVPGVASNEVTYCIRDARGHLREQILTAHVEHARVVALKDGTLAVIGPPRGEMNNGHLTLAGSAGAKTIPIKFEGDSDVARRAITQGMWLDGFEERQPGLLGGWIEHAGTMIGVEVTIDGRARHGAFVRDAGTVMVSGRYGVGWTSSQRGYETTDGGTTWRSIEVPEPVAAKNVAALRGCSAVGCVLEGWIRVGWGDGGPAAAPAPHSLNIARLSAASSLELTCDVAARTPIANAGRASAMASALSLSRARPSTEFAPFFGMAPPVLNPDEVGTTYDIGELVDRARPGQLARAYIWGSKGIEWDATSRFSVRWTSPFTSSANVFASTTAKPPRAIVEASRFAASAGSMRTLSSIRIATADDPKHALLVAERAAATAGHPAETFLVVLDDARAAVDVHRADGETFGRVDAAIRHEGRWFLLAEAASHEPNATVLWEIEGGVAREVLRVPRVSENNAKKPVWLARRDGEGMLGIVVEGQPNADRNVTTRWVLGVDVANGRASELELLGTTDFTRPIAACTGDEGGWAVDLPLVGLPVKATVQGKSITLKPGYGRLRFARGKTCVDRMAAISDGSADDLPPGRDARGSGGRSLEVGLVTGNSRQQLRCSNTKPAAP